MKKKSSFSGQIGFVLAAAGSAVGVGNLWRFPYLVAKDGGGLFLIIYIVLVLTFGFTLLTTDIAIGRKTGKSAVAAYETMRPGWKKVGASDFFGSNADYDVLCCDWWMDFKVFYGVSDRRFCRSSRRFLFYWVYHRSIICLVWIDFYADYRFYRI